MRLAELGDLAAVAGDQRRRGEVGELGHEQLFRRVANVGRIVDHQCGRMNALQQMGGRNVAHVEGRILTKHDHVEAGQILQHRLAQGEMVALAVSHRHGLGAG